MKREELSELHYIMPIANAPSVFTNGILSHKMAKAINHVSVSMQEIQERRAKVKIPGGKPLHDYVNLYFHARNPMMYKRRNQHNDLCILRVATSVLDLPGTIIADRNASSDYVRFLQSPGGLTVLDSNLVFAESWTSDDPIEQMKRASIKCAEVLVPEMIATRFIFGAYVSCTASRDELNRQIAKSGAQLEIVIHSHLFFQ